MKKTSITIILTFLLISGTCGKKDQDLHDNITFINQSNKVLFICGDWEYPDTLINFGNPLLAGDFNKVYANSSGDPLKIRYSFESMFKRVDKLTVFVFDAHILETTPWGTVKSMYLILKRYELTLQDLNNMNWTITYP